MFSDNKIISTEEKTEILSLLFDLSDEQIVDDPLYMIVNNLLDELNSLRTRIDTLENQKK